MIRHEKVNTQAPVTLASFFDICRSHYGGPKLPQLGKLFADLAAIPDFELIEYPADNDQNTPLLGLKPTKSNVIWDLGDGRAAKPKTPFAQFSRDKIISIFLTVPFELPPGSMDVDTVPLTYGKGIASSTKLMIETDNPELELIDLKSFLSAIVDPKGKSLRSDDIEVPKIIKGAMSDTVGDLFGNQELHFRFSNGEGKEDMTAAAVEMNASSAEQTCGNPTIKTTATFTGLEFTKDDGSEFDLSYVFEQDGKYPFYLTYSYPDDSADLGPRCSDKQKKQEKPKDQDPKGNFPLLPFWWLFYIASEILDDDEDDDDNSKMMESGIDAGIKAYDELNVQTVRSILNSAVKAMTDDDFPLNKDISSISTNDFANIILNSGLKTYFKNDATIHDAFEIITVNKWRDAAKPPRSDLVGLVRAILPSDKKLQGFAHAVNRVELFANVPPAAAALFSAFPHSRDTEIAMAITNSWGEDVVDVKTLRKSLKVCINDDGSRAFTDDQIAGTVKVVKQTKDNRIQLVMADDNQHYWTVTDSEPLRGSVFAWTFGNSNPGNPGLPTLWKVEVTCPGDIENIRFYLKTQDGKYLSDITHHLKVVDHYCLFVSSNLKKAQKFKLKKRKNKLIELHVPDENKLLTATPITADQEPKFALFRARRTGEDRWSQSFRPELMEYLLDQIR